MPTPAAPTLAGLEAAVLLAAQIQGRACRQRVGVALALGRGVLVEAVLVERQGLGELAPVLREAAGGEG